MTSHARLLERLRKGPLHMDDWRRLTGQTRLAARIEELRDKGHRIKTERDHWQRAIYVLVKERAGR